MQPILLAFNIAYHRALRDQGLEPDVVAGHSVGEFSAAVAAGMLSFEDALGAVHERGRIFREHQLSGTDTGAMAAVLADATRVEDELERWGLTQSAHPQVWLANRNCHSQSVVSGASAAVDAFAAWLSGRGLDSRRLAVTVAWHSPLARSLGEERARAAFSALSVRPPITPLWSSVDERIYSGAEGLSESFVRQLGAPLDFISLVRRLRTAGYDRFVEVGPRRILGSFVSDILSDVSHQLSSCDLPSRARSASEKGNR